MFTNKQLIQKWKPLLESVDAPKIEDTYRQSVTATLLENQEQACRQSREALNEDTPVNVAGNMKNYDPVMISLVRRAMPKLISYDIMGVQPMTGPTGLVFALRSRYVQNGALGDEAFYNEANSAFTGQGTQAGTSPSVLNDDPAGAYSAGSGIATANAELLGTPAGDAFPEMGFDIEKVSVTAKSRALKAQYTVELAQDLKQIHGLDVEQELAAILSSEILSEINREMVRTVYTIAKVGAQNTDLQAKQNNGRGGFYDLNTDSNGRWAVEKFKGLLYQIEREANRIAVETRRGKGNIIICSADVASALSMTGMLDTGRGLKDGMTMEIDPAGNTFVGTLLGRYKVYVDPYHIGDNYIVIGYKGSNAYDAGVFYCPYVPLQMFKVIDDHSFQPKMGFKTRYGMVANPFAEGLTKGAGALTANSNVYYRRFVVKNLAGTA